MAGRTKDTHKTHVCPYCLQCFKRKHTLDNHLPNCSIHKPQVMTFPTEGEDANLYYKDIRKEFTVPYVLYVDFESFLRPPYVYSGPDVMSHFYQHIYSKQETICEKLGVDKDMLPLTDGEKAEHQNSTTCPNSKNPFDQDWRKK